MSERVGAHARVAGTALADSAPGEATLYIINLLSSTTPMTLEVPYTPELEGFAVFRSRRIEDGRDRFRLHLGYFESQSEAERVLAAVRARYPAAWVALAPKDAMGSLDDTSVAQFKLIRSSRTGAPVAKPASAVQHASPAASAPVRAVDTPVKAAPVRATLVAPQSRHAPPSHPARPQLSPTDVLQLLESAPRASRPVAAKPQPAKAPPVAATASAAGVEPQKFAVQLIWSTNVVDAARVPQLAIFDAYTLYTVQVERAGRRWHGLRLGFFSDPVSARQVALYARSDFSAAAVVPVSERECARANEVAAGHGPRAAHPALGPKKDTDTIELKEDDTPRTRSAPLQESLLAPVTAAISELDNGTAAGKPRPADTKSRSIQVKTPPARPPSAPPKRAAKTTEELLEELGADTLNLDLSSGRDDLNDTGVRHLSVSVVNRKSPLGRLLAKVGRRKHA
jgi:hypothetical protein